MKRLQVTFESITANVSARDQALRSEVYWQEFTKTPIEAFEAGISVAIRECLFFPKPSEIHEFIRVYFEGKSTETIEKRIDWMPPTEEAKRIATQYLAGIFDRLKQNISTTVQPRLESKRGEAFEEKRKIAKHRGHGVNK